MEGSDERATAGSGAGGPPPVLGTECVPIPGCEDVCAP